MASAKEKTDLQHREAEKIVADGMSCAPFTYCRISPSDKLRPTFELFESASVDGQGEEKKIDPEETQLDCPSCISTLGHVDVTALQNLVLEGYNCHFPAKSNSSSSKTSGNESKQKDDEDEGSPLSPTNYWDPRNVAKYNVRLTRPAHDAWGIGKIVLLFCDDFLSKIYEFPWWKEFEAALQPVLDLLPKGHTMVRALLASLPPGVTIPVHHDTGEWVKHTHRVHIPLIVADPSKILFRCGPTADNMQRIDCVPGHVFEINNQAKHAVSNCGSDARVHVILDYMMEPKERIVLEPGETLVQTRRSIDRLKDAKENPRPTPSYFILGAQKSGTTSLYEYMIQHPLIIKARKRETHCLDWCWNDALKTKENQLAYCRKFYFSDELKLRPSCLTGDSTPSYLIDSRRVIPRMKDLFTWDIRFFVMLRDPVRRAESHFAMVTSPVGTPAQLKTRGSEWRDKSLRQVFDDEVAKMNDCGLIPYWNNDEGTVNLDLFDSFSGSVEEDRAWEKYLEKHVLLKTGSYGLLARGMYAVQLRPWFRAFDKEQFLAICLEKLHTDGVDATMSRVWEHLDLPKHTIQDDSPRNTRAYEKNKDEVIETMRRFFEPHNCRLTKLLGDEWKGVWDVQE